LSRLQRVSLPLLERDFVLTYLRDQLGVAETESAILARFAGGVLNNVERLVDGELFPHPRCRLDDVDRCVGNSSR